MLYQKERLVLVLALLMILAPVIVWAGVVQLPQTGQSKCYNAKGASISCADTGQDGDLRIGLVWPDSRFTVNTYGTVTDNLTGLVWTQNAATPDFGACTGDAMKWQEALDYIKCLNTYYYLGYNDWRLPNIVELESLAHAQQSSSSSWLNTQGFSGAEADFYWSSTTFAPNKTFAQAVYMGGGDVYSGHKLYHFYLVWPVRSEQSGLPGNAATWKTGQTVCYDGSGAETPCAGTGQDGELQAGAVWPSPRFADNNDETITDNLTGLIWTKDANTPGPTSCDPASDKTWQQSLDHISCLNSNNYLGYNDWRLPNRKELFSLIDFSEFNPSIPEGSPFDNIKSGGYWSSTSLSFDGDTHFARFIDMYNGYIDSDDKSYYPYTVWPVRAGVYLYTAISVSPAAIDSGNVSVASASSEKVLTISNSGNADLQISSIEVAGGDYSMFNIATGSCSSLTPTIPAGSGCTVKVTFTPASVGTKAATLSISSNDADTAVLEVALSGAGAPCSCTLSQKSKAMSASGSTGYINVNLKSPCNWTTSSDAEWLVITSGSSGASTGKISYSASPNTGTSARTGNITVEGKTFTVVQQGLPELSVTLSEITTAKVGKYYRFSGDLTVNNVSETRATGVTAKVYLSTDAVYDTADKSLGAITVGTLSADGNRVKNLNSLKTLDNPSGKYLVVVLDPSDKIKEADETNNTAVSSAMP